MANNQSLADDLIVALSEVKRIGQSMDNEHPMRHQVRNMKEMACRILTDAAYQATSLAYQAQQLIKDFDDAKGGTA